MEAAERQRGPARFVARMEEMAKKLGHAASDNVVIHFQAPD